MAFSGAGVFSRIHNWIADRDNGIKIVASRHDAEDDGFATGLSNCICRDGQSTITAAIPFSTQRITGLGNATADTDALNRITADSRYLEHGNCYLSWTDSSTITLSPESGNQITIDNKRETIPAAGITLSASGTSEIVYFIYAYMSGATMTLEYSATALQVDTRNGIYTKSGDNTRTWVGKAFASPAGSWSTESSVVASVMSWFNPRRRILTSGTISNSTASTGYITLTSLYSMTHPFRPVSLTAQGYTYASVGTGALFGLIETSLGEVLSLETVIHSQATNIYRGFAASGNHTGASGFYEYRYDVHVDAGTGNWVFVMNLELWG